MTRIYSLNFCFKKSQIADLIQIYIRGMKFINLSVSFKQATHLSKRIQIRFLRINTTMIIREVNRFTEGTLIIKLINTKNNKS